MNKGKQFQIEMTEVINERDYPKKSTQKACNSVTKRLIDMFSETMTKTLLQVGQRSESAKLGTNTCSIKLVLQLGQSQSLQKHFLR